MSKTKILMYLVLSAIAGLAALMATKHEQYGIAIIALLVSWFCGYVGSFSLGHETMRTQALEILYGEIAKEGSRRE